MNTCDTIVDNNNLSKYTNKKACINWKNFGNELVGINRIKLSNNISKIWWYNITVLFNLGVIYCMSREKERKKYEKQLEKTAKEIIKNID